jgi:hypothetical protein
VTQNKPVLDRGCPVIPGEERRRSQRVILRTPVTLHLTVADRPFSVRAHTVAVNDHGAMLICSRSFQAEEKMEIQNDNTRQRVGCRVTRAPRETPEGYLIPIEFREHAPGFWQINFPPADWKPRED